MDRKTVEEGVRHIFYSLEENYVKAEDALAPELAGVRLFDEPIIGIANAKDELFLKFKSDDVVTSWYMMPEQWMEGAESVISVFFPLSSEIRESNYSCKTEPSFKWLHGRIEGQQYINLYMEKLQTYLANRDIKSCIPNSDSRMKAVMDGKTFASNWSERHTAYVCGLGTFGLSKGLITEKGIAGRFASIITDKEVEADERKYDGIYDYCSKCGACIRRCPVQSISMESGNKLAICKTQIDAMLEKYNPRYGCGLCRTRVPCEKEIPVAVRKNNK